IFVAPLAGILSVRIGTRPIIVTGLALQALALGWLSFVVSPTVDYLAIIPAFIVAGTGMGMYFGPTANVVLSSVRPEEAGKASGAKNAMREVGGVFGIAVLASIFSANGSYLSGQAFVDGMIPALRVGAVVVAIGSVVGLAMAQRVRAAAPATVEAGLLE